VRFPTSMHVRPDSHGGSHARPAGEPARQRKFAFGAHTLRGFPPVLSLTVVQQPERQSELRMQAAPQ